ncbi:MAG TPA: M1 family peptidase, partial [Holophagaceae bacterium]
MYRPDPHSFYESSQPKTRRLRLKFGVDFERKRIEGEATLEFGDAVQGDLDLDTKGLEILSVKVPGLGPIPWSLGDEDAILGRRLRLALPAGTREVAVQYLTSPEAMALQWLDPAQTEGKVAPYLFSQCQQIHART